MGTTATIATFLDDRLFVGQVGDSRAYLLRGEKLALLSRDQSLVNQLVEAGQLTEQEAETFEHNNIILQALGTAETVQVDLTYVDLCKGDVLMICSDGLNGMINAEEIRETLLRCKEPLDACRELTDRANAAGGHDNITVIVACFGDGFEEPTPTSTFGYQKYALPDQTPEAALVMPATYAPGKSSSPPSAGASQASGDGQKLRVSHTMVGMVSPFEDTLRTGEAPPELRADQASVGGQGPAAATPAGRGGARPGERISEEPVALPTHSFPPALLGIIVVCSMLLAALFGYLFLR
jgi:hypothetical protein